MCHNLKCSCRKQITFTPQQFQIEAGSRKRERQKFLRGTQTAWNNFVKPAINPTAPFIGVAVSAKKTNPKVGRATTKTPKSTLGGKILSLTDLHGNGLRSKVL